MFSANYYGNFLGNLSSRHRARHCECAGAHIFGTVCAEMDTVGAFGTSGEKLTVLGDAID